MRFKTFVESLDSDVEYTLGPKYRSGVFFGEAKIGGRTITVDCEREFENDDPSEDAWTFMFAERLSVGEVETKLTGNGDELQVFAFAKDMLEKLIERFHPFSISFSADHDEPGRAKLYDRILKRHAHPAYRLVRTDQGSFIYYQLLRKDFS